MWGVTDAHPDTRGCCPYMCKEAFGSGRAPDTALPAGKRPPPPAFAAALATFQAADCPAADPPVVPAPQADAPADVAPSLHLACTDPDEVPEDPDDDADLHGLTGEDYDWPAFRETPWVPSIVTNAETQKTLERN
ncbi:hypothetical protein CYMTET_32999 [Cymbomonas tetramitiformis]|uniref:Uncharacterized protein n=1 Tax=Cymbomonas tetramitiformis TaxID=36881 RepID=A0AAE0FEL0_9CHLO|nr:hypothetical protein CYMTET_32999 [Cymbomonas tetramitiformis]